MLGGRIGVGAGGLEGRNSFPVKAVHLGKVAMGAGSSTTQSGDE